MSTRAQEEAMAKAGLLLEVCSYEPEATMMVLRDDATLSLNNDYSLRLDRKITFKFFKEQKIAQVVGAIVFYPSSAFERYYKLTVNIVEIDATTKAVIEREVTAKITNTHIEQAGLKARKGTLLEVSYSINLPYDEKLPDWRFQAAIPTEYSAIRLRIPEVIALQHTLYGGYKPDAHTATEAVRPVRLHNKTQNLKMAEVYYQYSQLPADKPEPYSDLSPKNLTRLHFHIDTITMGDMVQTDLIEKQIQKVIETLSSRVDFLLRLGPTFELKADYDRRIKSLTNPEEKIARIYDLVRRHQVWSGVDSLFAPRPLVKVWNDKKANSTEINLVLVKLLQQYGFDANPLIVSTRKNGVIDTNDIALTDFNRTVACVKLVNNNIILDATARFSDYPMLSLATLNTFGLLISMDQDRWVAIQDTGGYYRNSVTLLGSLIGDSSFLTMVYVNSKGYAKAEHLEILEYDSLKGLRRYFERGNKNLHFKHLIVANEYIDTLPLAQEFDVRIPIEKNENLYSILPTWFAVPDTLFTIAESRKGEVTFGYRQEYTLISEFSFPERYEIYLLPNAVQLSAFDGMLHFEREFHNAGSNFSLRQTLTIDKGYFHTTEAIELGKFLKKIKNLTEQRVILKRLN